MFRRKKGEYRPPGKLIGVICPLLYLGPGVFLFLAGVVLVTLALVLPMQHTRRHPEDPHLQRILTGTVGGVVATTGAGAFLAGYRQCRRLAREGRTAQAVITGRWRRWQNQYYIAYEFMAQLPDGTTPTVVCRISDKELYDRFEIGDQLTVRYLPSDLRIGEPVPASRPVRPRDARDGP